MKPNIIISLVCISLTCVTLVAAQDSAGARSKQREILDRVLVSDRGYKDDETLQQVIALGIEAVPEIRQYLNGTGYDRALYVLSQLPEVARESILEGLRSSFDGMKLAALELSEPFLIANDQEVLDAWTAAFCGVVDFPSGLPSRYDILLKADESFREQACTHVIECVIHNMPRYSSADGAMAMIQFLSRRAEPGSQIAINAIRDVRKRVDTQFNDNPELFNRKYGALSNRQRVLEACQYALANLGDAESLASLIQDMKVGKSDDRIRHIGFLPRMHERRDLLEAAFELLGDDTSFYKPVPGGFPYPTYAYTFVMRALADWFPDFPVKQSWSYKGDDIIAAKIWLGKKILKLDELPNSAQQAVE